MWHAYIHINYIHLQTNTPTHNYISTHTQKHQVLEMQFFPDGKTQSVIRFKKKNSKAQLLVLTTTIRSHTVGYAGIRAVINQLNINGKFFKNKPVI